MSVKICGYCKLRGGERVAAAKYQRVDFTIPEERRSISIWFCSGHCIFWGGVQHARSGSATTVKALRDLFGAGVEVLK